MIQILILVNILAKISFEKLVSIGQWAHIFHQTILIIRLSKNNSSCSIMFYLVRITRKNKFFYS